MSLHSWGADGSDSFRLIWPQAAVYSCDQTQTTSKMLETTSKMVDQVKI